MDELYHYKAKVRRVVDGDTIIVDIDVGFGLTHSGPKKKGVNLRLKGYNSPETRGIEKEFGKMAKAHLQKLIPKNSTIMIRTYDVDSFGRWLVDVYLSTEGTSYDGTTFPHRGYYNLVKHLVKEGWGVIWNGKGDRPSFNMNENYPLRR